MPALSVSIVTRLLDGNFRTHGPLRANRFPVKNSCGTHPASYSIDTGRFLLGEKRPEHEADHSSHLMPSMWISFKYTSIVLYPFMACIGHLYLSCAIYWPDRKPRWTSFFWRSDVCSRSRVLPPLHEFVTFSKYWSSTLKQVTTVCLHFSVISSYHLTLRIFKRSKIC
jgi:hypothetical protein